MGSMVMAGVFSPMLSLFFFSLVTNGDTFPDPEKTMY